VLDVVAEEAPLHPRPELEGEPAPDEEEREDPADPEEAEDASPPSGAVGELLLAAWAELERLAEGGSAAYRGFGPLGALGDRAEARGLARVASALRRLADAGLGAPEDASERLQRIAMLALCAAYVVRATELTAAVDAATSGYA
jgi:hypothetical protein